jgi:hypothetical protein
LVWWLGENPNLPSRKALGGGRLGGGRRPVIVSLALARGRDPVGSSAADKTSGRGRAGREQEEEENDFDESESERERERFAGIMGMIAEWSGE